MIEDVNRVEIDPFSDSGQSQGDWKDAGTSKKFPKVG